MPALEFTCIDPPPFRRPPRLNIPNLGILEAAFDRVGAIPDPVDLVVKFMDAANLALAPIRKYLQLVEALVAVKQCVEALPRAIMTLSPSPVFDCLKALARAFAAVMQDIPPFPYIQTVVDLCSYLIDLIDALTTLLTTLDNKIDRLLDLRAYAAGIGDVDLIRFGNCGLKDVTIAMQQIMYVMKLVAPLMNILVSVMLRLIPTPAAQKAANEALEAATQFDTTLNALDNIDITVTGLPKLSPTFVAMNKTRNALVVIHNIMATIVGEAANKQPVEMPEFIHF